MRRLSLVLSFLASACGSQPKTEPQAASTEVVVSDAAEHETANDDVGEVPGVVEDSGARRVDPDGLVIEELAPGSGREAQKGDRVAVHYDGTLPDGERFDSSIVRGQPFVFKLGGGQVIQGFERGVLGMRPGGRRRVTIPPELGYGARGAGGKIPPNATLIFEIELIEFADAQ